MKSKCQAVTLTNFGNIDYSIYGYIINHKYNSNIGFLDSSEDYYQNSKQLNFKKSGTEA